MIHTARRIVAGLALSALCAQPALAEQAPSKSDVIAFERTAAVRTFECRMMLAGVRQYDASWGAAEWHVEAASASGCLQNVRSETSNPVPARAPRFMLLASCKWIDDNEDTTIQACVNVPE